MSSYCEDSNGNSPCPVSSVFGCNRNTKLWQENDLARVGNSHLYFSKILLVYLLVCYGPAVSKSNPGPISLARDADTSLDQTTISPCVQFYQAPQLLGTISNNMNMLSSAKCLTMNHLHNNYDSPLVLSQYIDTIFTCI